MWWLILLVVAAIIAAAYLATAYLRPGAPGRPGNRTLRRDERIVAAFDPEAVEMAAAPLLVPIAVIALAVIVIIALVQLGHRSSGERAGPQPSAARPPAGANRAPLVGNPAATSVPDAAPPRAQASSLGARYQTAGAGVHVRAAATEAAPVVTTIADFGSWVTLTCHQQGGAVFGDTEWYRVEFAGVQGYVSGLWIDAGGAASTGLPSC